MTNSENSVKVIVITGGSSGIGAACALEFINLGFKVFVLDQINAFSPLQGVDYIECNITSEESSKNAFKIIASKVDAIDIVCANAGVVPKWSRITEIEIESWNHTLAVNSTGLMLTLKYATPLMKKNSGTIVVTASINSWKGDPNITAYVASKHAALGIIRSAAMDLGEKGVRINGVAPGPVATAALVERIRERTKGTNSTVNQSLAEMASKTALGRIATIGEVVNTIKFLALEGSSGITGQIIHIDGGIL